MNTNIERVATMRLTWKWIQRRKKTSRKHEKKLYITRIEWQIVAFKRFVAIGSIYLKCSNPNHFIIISFGSADLRDFVDWCSWFFYFVSFIYDRSFAFHFNFNVEFLNHTSPNIEERWKVKKDVDRTTILMDLLDGTCACMVQYV